MKENEYVCQACSCLCSFGISCFMLLFIVDFILICSFGFISFPFPFSFSLFLAARFGMQHIVAYRHFTIVLVSILCKCIYVFVSENYKIKE